MGPGMFDGVVEGLVILVSIFIVLAFLAGIGVSSCVSAVGHPTIGWSK
jgi:hypothetical protein